MVSDKNQKKICGRPDTIRCSRYVVQIIFALSITYVATDLFDIRSLFYTIEATQLLVKSDNMKLKFQLV